MRATISFEADVSRVNDVMRSLVLEESNALQDALIALEKATADRIVEGISEALEHIQGVATQLEQYQQMMVSFEKARFETILPQPAGTPLTVSSSTQSKQDALNENRFNSFLDRINMENDDVNTEEG
jgi:hypothetical protein